MHSRREFLRRSGFLAAGFLGLQSLSRAALPGSTAPALAGRLPMRRIHAYGPLMPDPQRIFDLPKGFRYSVISRQGARMDDGFLVPGDPDGMAAFGLPGGRIGLIRNHELAPVEFAKGPFGPQNELLEKAPRSFLYDYGSGKWPGLGGTTTIVFDPRTGTVEREYLSLAGTEKNCAGGPTPWGSWVSCEETATPQMGDFEKSHGYNFEVPLSAEIAQIPPVPLEEMGRFRHEAIAVDPRSGAVYQTEDLGDGLIYRYLPKVKGRLAEGGRLQALAIIGQPSRDTRNWSGTDQPVFPRHERFAVRWIDLEDVRSPDDTLRFQGFEKGAARFARGEGMWYGHGEVYFACTNGGALEKGQVFRYLPSRFEGTAREAEEPGMLELFIESTDESILKNCDNLTVAPWGDLFICEDADEPCNLVGVTPQGSFFEFGSNRYSPSELAGVCFSPDGQYLFLNIQGDGLTLAITGPWQHSL